MGELEGGYEKGGGGSEAFGRAGWFGLAWDDLV